MSSHTRRGIGRRRRALLLTAATPAGQAAGAAGAGAKPQAVPRSQWLFEPKHGLAIVRKKLKYGELLREIRQGRVRDVLFFDNDHLMENEEDFTPVEGPCLVLFRDGHVEQAYIPPYDVRMQCAMETHGVRADRIATPMTAKDYKLYVPVGRVTKTFLTALPIIALGVAYAATQFAAFLKGDLDDRKKILAADIRKEKELEMQREADDLAMEARTLATMGWSVEEIVAELKRINVPFNLEYVTKLVAEERAKAAGAAKGPVYTYNTEAEQQAEALRKAKEAPSGEASDFDKAAEFGRLRTVKVQQAAAQDDTEREVAQEMAVRMRQAQRNMKGVKLQYTEAGRITFDDVAGIGDAKVELMEVVDFFLKPERFRRSGAKIPKGVLLCGPPGTGKTLLARAVAGEARVAFLSLNASEFVEMFVGVGASRVRDLFSQARTLAPAIIFVDEIDAVGRVRGGAMGNDERDQTLNQLLSEMDGFSARSAVIVMAATNRRDVLDPALTRPGRFDRIIYVGKPDFEGRIEILKVHLEKRLEDGRRRPHTLTEEQLHAMSFETREFSGAMLASLVNSAALAAGRSGREAVTFDDLEQALEEERLGPRREPYSDDRSMRLAVQEGATALVCSLLPAIEPVVLVTIVPREKYPLGQTVCKVNEQRERTRMFTRRYLEEQLLTVLAGRAAEELVYGLDEVSTINQRRLIMARRIVTKLVAAAAMSDAPVVGPRTLTQPYDMGGRTLLQVFPRRYTNEMQYGANVEMERLLNEAAGNVRALLQRNRAALDVIVSTLTVKGAGSLSGDEVRAIVREHGCPEDLRWLQEEAASFM
ncbi:hypothetical protein WJX81_007049 [Elliptochloris bilobata]|uniref:AAA+ ATPase domain-containing protein n=1 Tax=Elliptochloris bilobata TaxID=381761 RepID=A0AAW1QNK2_9CHLO